MEPLVKDFTIKCAGEILRTNRESLRKSSDFFAALFSSPGWKENAENILELHDIQPETLQQVVEYIERSTLDLSEQNAMDLLAASEMLQIEQLKNRIENYFADRLGSVEDVKAKFPIADKYNCSRLKDRCLKFAAWCFPQLVESLDSGDYDLVHTLVQSPYLHWDENLVYEGVKRVMRGLPTDKVTSLVDALFLDNLSASSSEGLSLLQSLSEDSPPRSGFRHDAATVGFVDGLVLFAWNRRTGCLEPLTKLPVRAVGYSLVRHQRFVYLIGGEGRIGIGDWNMDVYRYDCVHNGWEGVNRIDGQRRSCQSLVAEDRIYLFNGYGRYRSHLDSVSVFDLEVNGWNEPGILTPRAPGPPRNTVVFLNGLFYHCVSTTKVYRMRISHLVSGRNSQVAIPCQHDAVIVYAAVLDKRILIVTLHRHVMLWDPEGSVVTPLDVELTDCDSGGCLLIDRTLYIIDLSSNEMTEFHIDLKTNSMKRIATHILKESGREEKPHLNGLCIVPYF